jgi:hypothetical protein
MIARNRTKQVTYTEGTEKVLHLGRGVSRHKTFALADIAVDAEFDYLEEHTRVSEWEVGRAKKIDDLHIEKLSLFASSEDDNDWVSFSFGEKHISITVAAETVEGTLVPVTLETIMGELDSARLVNVIPIGLIPALPYATSGDIDDALIPYYTAVQTNSSIATALIPFALTADLAPYLLSSVAASTYATPANITAALSPYLLSATAASTYVTPAGLAGGTLAFSGTTLALTGDITFGTSDRSIYRGAVQRIQLTATALNLMNANVVVGSGTAQGKLSLYPDASGKGIVVRLNATTPGNAIEVQSSAGAGIAYINGTGEGVFTGLSNTANTTLGQIGGALGRLTVFGGSGAKGIVVRMGATTPDNPIEVQNSSGIQLWANTSAGDFSFNRNTLLSNAQAAGTLTLRSGSVGALVLQDSTLSYSSGDVQAVRVTPVLNSVSGASRVSIFDVAPTWNGALPSAYAAAARIRMIGTQAANALGLLIVGATSQTADLLRVTDVGENVIAAISGAGVGRFAGLRLDITPTVEVLAGTVTIPISIGGVAYKLIARPA